MKFKTLLFVLIFLASSALAGAVETKPNIVLVLMDNFGWGELGTYGGGILLLSSSPFSLPGTGIFAFSKIISPGYLTAVRG